MADIVAANVTAVKHYEITLPNVKGELKKAGVEEIRMVVGTITVATNADYDDTTEIPLDNLFDSTKTSYLGLAESTCKQVGTALYQGATFVFPVIFDWAGKKLRILALPATPTENEGFDEVADATAVGIGTIQFTVIGKVK